MTTAGLRNWRGEVTPSVALPAPSHVNGSVVTCEIQRPLVNSGQSVALSEAKADETVSSGKDQRPMATTVLQKDEFGRDVEVVVDTHKGDKERKRKRKHVHTRDKCRRDRSSADRSRSSSRRRCGTSPPPDPFRPQLDERREKRSKRRKESRSRSRSRRRSRDETKYHRRQSRRRDFSRSRSRSRERRRQRRSRSATQSSRRRSSASVERKWTHSAFDDRSPSPPRELDPFYRPEPEAWVSRAGGVYLPRK